MVVATLLLLQLLGSGSLSLTVLALRWRARPEAVALRRLAVRPQPLAPSDHWRHRVTFDGATPWVLNAGPAHMPAPPTEQPKTNFTFS